MARLRNNGFLGRHLERIWEAHRLNPEERVLYEEGIDGCCSKYYSAVRTTALFRAYSIQPPSHGIVAAHWESCSSFWEFVGSTWIIIIVCYLSKKSRFRISLALLWTSLVHRVSPLLLGRNDMETWKPNAWNQQIGVEVPPSHDSMDNRNEGKLRSIISNKNKKQLDWTPPSGR